MIVTVTPNPSIDRTVRIARLERGELNRTSAPVSEAAGKGLNVSRALHRHAVDTIAVLPLAADSASVYLTLLGDAVPTAPVPTRGSIRTNLTVLEADGTVTKLNEPGPAVDDGDVEALLTSVAAIGADWVVGCGSLPPGAPTSFSGTTGYAHDTKLQLTNETSTRGGSYNFSSSFDSAVSGGYLNTASGNRSSVSGGYSNAAANGFSAVAGGCSNLAGAVSGLAAVAQRRLQQRQVHAGHGSESL